MEKIMDGEMNTNICDNNQKVVGVEKKNRNRTAEGSHCPEIAKTSLDIPEVNFLV
jgi:hypothetical protein